MKGNVQDRRQSIDGADETGVISKGRVESAVIQDMVKAMRYQLQRHGKMIDLDDLTSASPLEEDQLQEEDTKTPQTQTNPKKRGRKRKEDPEAILEDGDVDVDTRRRLQNRAAQRQFRQRKEARVTELEARVKEQDTQIAALKALCESLHAEKAGRAQGPSSMLPKLESQSPTHTETDVSPSEGVHAAASILTSGSKTPQSQLLMPTAHGQPAELIQPKFAPDPPVFASLPAQLTPVIDLASAPTTNEHAYQSSTVDMAAAPIDLSFDFEAPFDFNPDHALPPLFQSYLDEYTASLENSPAPGAPGVPKIPVLSQPEHQAPLQSNGIVTSSATSLATAPDAASEDQEDASGDDFCPGDDPTALERSQMPCPECDFSVISCALPMPWRPPTISGSSKDVWVSGKAWAKLCSHPMFNQCNVDELCTELRDRVRCSDDGRLVIAKSDVCDVFRTIPARARLRRQLAEMSGV